MSPGPRALPREILTQRLRLAVPRREDAPALLEVIEESRSHFHPWIHLSRARVDLATLATKSAEAADCFRTGEFFVWRVFERETQRMVGTLDLHHLDWDVPRGELGYWLRKSATGRGYAREALGAVIAAAWELGFERLEAHCDERNTASQRVVEGLGFRHEGTLIHCDRDSDGILCDDRVYALLRPKD